MATSAQLSAAAYQILMVFLIVALLVHLLLLINLRFEAWPEMLVYPYLINNGFKLYQDIINPYPPLFTYFLAGYFKIFPVTVFNLQVLTWTIILLSDVLIYWIARRRYGRTPALLALIFFIVFQPLLDGNGLWYDLALTPLLLLAFYFKSPVLIAVSFFVKQSVIWLFLLFFKSWKRLLISLFILFVIGYVLFAITGTATDYLFWPWKFALTIFPIMPGHKDLGSLRMWLIALTPFLPLIFLKKNNLFLWIILSFLFIFPRFGLFHLQPALAFAALSLAASLQSIKLKKYLLPATCYLLLAGLIWVRQIKLYWHQSTRFFEPEIIKAAAELKIRTVSQQPLLFLNAPDQLLVLADRLPIKPWAITFPWYLELPNLQQRFINALINQKVTTVVFSPYQQQRPFTPGSYIPQLLEEFVNRNFTTLATISANIQLKSTSAIISSSLPPQNQVLVQVTSRPLATNYSSSLTVVDISNYYPHSVIPVELSAEFTATPTGQIRLTSGPILLGNLTSPEFSTPLKPVEVTRQAQLLLTADRPFSLVNLKLKFDHALTRQKVSSVITQMIDDSTFRYLADVNSSRTDFLRRYPIFKAGTQDNELILPVGIYALHQTLLIPRGLEVILQPGVTLKLAPQTSVISYAKIIARGLPNQPIVFTNLFPQPWGVLGLVGSQASGSQFDYLIVEQASSAVVNGIYFTGGLAAHYADVSINHSQFRLNHGDDGVNVKHAEFILADSQFLNNDFDGLDLDVASGKVTNNIFNHSGNDGIDISFSSALIQGNQISYSGDKCISVGEKSTSQILSNQLSYCHDGVAIKDSSRAVMEGNTFRGNQIAVAAYQKKPIFGGGRVIFKPNLLIDNRQDFDISPNSTLEKP